MAFYPGKTTALDLSVTSAAPSQRLDPSLAVPVRDFLRTVRRANGAGWTEPVAGHRVLERVIKSDDGSIFYHLTHAARELLRGQGLLPWGAS